LEYCNQIWHFNIPEYLSKDIERIQRRALRIIHQSLSYYDALMVCNIPTLHSRREQLCSAIFKIKVVPESSPQSGLVKIAAIPKYDLRAQRNLHQSNAQQTASKTLLFRRLLNVLIILST
jgi:hypothetical protein